MRLSRFLSVLLLLLACSFVPTGASAHPADMYAQDQTITLTPGGLGIDWKILPGPFLADAAWAAADLDHNGTISASEAQAWVAPFLSDFTVTIDGQPSDKILVQGIHWPDSVDVLRTGDDAVQVTLQMGWPTAATGRHALELHNAHFESNSLNWFSMAASDGLTFSRPAQDNGRVSLDILFPATSAVPAEATPSAKSGLTTWTSGTPNLPTFTSSLSRLATNLSNPQPSAPTGGEAASPPSSATSALTGLVRNAQLSPLFLLTAFLLSLALGSLHALTPGHGKALVGAYLVGSRGRVRDAVLLGGIVTLTHTGSVLALGLVTLLASHYILPSLIVPWLELISGLLVIAFGLNLLVQRASLKRASPTSAPRGAEAERRRDFLGRTTPGQAPAVRRESPAIAPHAHDHTHGLTHEHPHDHTHIRKPAIGDQQSARSNPESQFEIREAGTPPVTVRSLLALGISGGLVPCPDAIAILLVAVALNRVPFGMLLIVSFSLGLAAVLIGIGIAMVQGVRLISRSDWLVRFGSYAPVVSAVVVSGLGLGLTLNAWNSFKFSTSVGAAATPSSTQPQSYLRLLYVASDAAGRDQLFMMPLNAKSPQGNLPQPGGAASQYTHEDNGLTGYSISPDGRTILYSVFKTGGGSALWAINADGTGRRLVLDCPQAECNSPAWYPDGSKLAYERLENTADSTTIPRFSIWWLDLATGATQPVFQDASFPSATPRFSPDGQWLSYISAASNTLVAYNLEEARTLSVPLGSQSAIPERWSPTGEALLFGSRASQGESPTLHVKTYALATGSITDLGGTHGETDFSAAWSPDGKWIAIDRNVPDASGSSNQVWLVRPDGSGAHALLSEAGASYSSLSWSADGRLLLYSRYKLQFTAGAAGNFDVLATDITSGETILLAPGGDLGAFLP